jgi:hypothetical protein
MFNEIQREIISYYKAPRCVDHERRAHQMRKCVPPPSFFGNDPKMKENN